MDSIVPSRRIHTSRKGNKENCQSVHGSKSFVKQDKTSAAPFQRKGNKKEPVLSSNDPLKFKPTDATLVYNVVKKVATVQRDGMGSCTATTQRQTHSQAFITEHSAKIPKISAEAPKPPAAVAPVKAAPGLYKGRIIQSKIGSIWKSSSSLNGPDPKAPAVRTEIVGNVAKSRSKSVSEVPARGTCQPAVIRSKSAVDKRSRVTKPAAGSRAAAAFASTRPPTRTVPTATVAPKPKVTVTDKKVSRPPASSSLSQYRLNVETAEERRAKLAEWLASKGKTLKRPAMAASAAPAKIKIAAKSRGCPKPLSGLGNEARPAAHREREAEADAQCAELRKTPLVMESSLQLLEDSELDPQDGVEDIVVNLCRALEAMEPPSGCSDDTQVTTQNNDAEMESSKPEDGRCEEIEPVVSEEDDSDEEEEVGSDEDVRELLAEEASVIKYSIKTTPYLQSVKKTLEGEADTTSSRKKINIGDLKLVTPVRRSSRIHRKSSRLPAMLLDHDPSVSSLAELVTLDHDPNAFVCRRNTALLDELPADRNGH